jgi:regulator of sirC expression with transglutaminase-like and TPR domain
MGPARFRQLVAGDRDAIALDETSLAIAAALQPGLDELHWLAELDLIAGSCPSPTPESIAAHVFGDLGFSGNRDAYYDWRNSCLDRVIATRTGIPISLSVLMIEVGRRLGVGLVGVGMPAHFLVRVADDPQRFFDPFDGGRALGPAGARELFETVTRGQVAWRDEHLLPTPPIDIVVRMLNNLKVVFTRRADRVRFGIVMQLRAAIDELADAESEELAAALAVFN